MTKRLQKNQKYANSLTGFAVRNPIFMYTVIIVTIKAKLVNYK